MNKLQCFGLIMAISASNPIKSEEYVIQETGLVYEQLWRDFDRVIPDRDNTRHYKSAVRNRNKVRHQTNRQYYDRSYSNGTSYQNNDADERWAEEILNDYIR